jgi:hypothetical protein
MQTACLGLIRLSEPPVLAQPPEKLTDKCHRPVRLPPRGLTQLEVETFWIQDRRNLANCADRHKALADFYYKRDERIMGQ